MREEYKSLDNIVFENKNKKYGAYDLRRIENKVLLRSFIIGTIIFLLIISLFWFFSVKDKEFVQNKGKDEDVDLIDVELPPIEEEPEPEEEEPIEIPEPPKETPPTTVKQIETVKVEIPEPKKEPKKEEPIKKEEEIEKAQIGFENTPGEKPGSDVTKVKGDKEDVVGVSNQTTNEIFDKTAQKAEFKDGGTVGLLKFIKSRLKYPKEAERKGIETQLIIKFVVEKDGTVSSFSVKNDPGYGFKQEVERVLRLTSGRWKPGLNADKFPVRSYFSLPVDFKIEK